MSTILAAAAKALAEVHDREWSSTNEAAAYAIGAYKNSRTADETEEGGDGGSSSGGGGGAVAMDTSSTAGQASAGGGASSSSADDGSGGSAPAIDDSLYSRQRYVMVSLLLPRVHL